jgi:ribosome biogenesis GTPase
VKDYWNFAMKKSNERSLENEIEPTRIWFTEMTGTVFKVTNGRYNVCVDGRMISCTLASGLFRQANAAASGSKSKRGRKYDDQSLYEAGIVVGDRVRLADDANGTGRILEVESRRSQLSRRSAVPMPSAHASEQVIAANVDQVVPVFAAAEPAPKWNMLDRYLALAESLDLPALIVITKLDLALDADGRVEDELLAAVDEYRHMDYPVILTSAVSGYGLDVLRSRLQAGLSVLLGKSGVENCPVECHSTRIGPA